MTEFDIWAALLENTQPAADCQEAVKEKLMARLDAGPARRALRPARALAACLAALLVLTAATPQGRALAAEVKESVVELWLQLFPPKEITVDLEGMDGEKIVHTPTFGTEESGEGGEEAAAGSGGEEEEKAPAFVLYVDESRYIAAWEGDEYVVSAIPVEYDREGVRWSLGSQLEGLTEAETEEAIQAELQRLREFRASLPKCDLRVSHLAGVAPEDAAKQTAEKLAQTYGGVTAPELSGGKWYIHAGDGTAWDSPVADVTVTDDRQGGAYVITVRYFLEAAEGHGVRLSIIAGTFALPEQGEISGNDSSFHALK